MSSKLFTNGIYPQKFVILLYVMSFLGLAVSVYLTIAHYSNTALVCTNNSFINCTDVTSSVFSYIPKTAVPVSLLGIIWFVINLLLISINFLNFTFITKSKKMIENIHFLWASSGLAFVFYFVYTEIFRLKKICEWCTFVHLTVIIMFFLLYYLQKKLNNI